MEDEKSEINPYQSPVANASSSLPPSNPEDFKPFRLDKSILRWSLICGISAAPSFILAMPLANKALFQVLGMLGGILTFVILYVYIESLEWTRRKMMNRSLRLAVIVGYVTRIAISIIFPVAIFIDMFCGMLSVSFSSAFFGTGPMGDDADFRTKSELFVLAWFYTTTVVQGIVLNVVLAGYTLIVYAVAVVIRGSED